MPPGRHLTEPVPLPLPPLSTHTQGQWPSAVRTSGSFASARPHWEVQGTVRTTGSGRGEIGTGFDFKMKALRMEVLLAFSGILLAVQGCPNIVSRSEWSQRASLCNKMLPPSRKYAVIHHTQGKRCFSMVTCKKQLQNIQSYHMDTRKWCDIGYNFLIGEDGNIYEGRGWKKQGAHACGYNSNSLGISIMGNFMSDAPNNLALNAAQNLIRCLASKGYLASNYVLKGHRQLGKTSCPGNTLYNIIKKWRNWS